MRQILFCMTFLLVGNGAWAQQEQQEQEDERGVIRLNPNDPTLDAWKELRDTSNDPKREPGPINIQRMSGGQGWTGIPTFFMLPVALTPEDLIAGEVDVAIMGAPSIQEAGCAVPPSDPKPSAAPISILAGEAGRTRICTSWWTGCRTSRSSITAMRPSIT